MLIQANYSTLIKQERVLDASFLTQQFRLRERAPRFRATASSTGQSASELRWGLHKAGVYRPLYSFKTTDHKREHELTESRQGQHLEAAGDAETCAGLEKGEEPRVKGPEPLPPTQNQRLSSAQRTGERDAGRRGFKGIAYPNERVTNERSYFQMTMKEVTHWITPKENSTRRIILLSKGGGTVDGESQVQEHPGLHHEFKTYMDQTIRPCFKITSQKSPSTQHTNRK